MVIYATSSEVGRPLIKGAADTAASANVTRRISQARSQGSPEIRVIFYFPRGSVKI